MPRNGSGAYAPPSNSFNPAVANTTIDPAAWAQILSDLAAAITASIARDGQTATSQRIPFAAGVGLNDGAAALPALAFIGSPTTGLYASGADELAVAIDGARQVKVSEDGVELTQPLPLASGGTGAANAGQARANLGLSVGADVQAHDADLDAVAALAANGLVTRTGSGAASARTLTGTSGEVAVANGDGVSGNPTISLPSSLNFAGKTVTGGTFAGPTFTGTDSGTTLVRYSGAFAGLTVANAPAAVLEITSSAGSARVEFDKNGVADDAGFQVKQGGAVRWICGEMGSSGTATGEFVIARYGTGAKGIKIDPSSYRVVVTNDLVVGGSGELSGELSALTFTSLKTVVSVPSGIPTTFFTAPNSQATWYEVYAQIGSGGVNAAGWGRATIRQDNLSGSLDLVNPSSGGSYPISITATPGLAVRVAQSSGSLAAIYCTMLRIK